MPYLNVDIDYFEHPKTIRLVGLLGRGAEVLPIKLWKFCGKYHVESGKLTGYATQEIESVCAWWGKEGEMVSAMVKVGFITKIDDGFEVNDWLDHQGHLVYFKERAKKGAEKRWNLSNATSNASMGGQAMPLLYQPTIPTNKSTPVFNPPSYKQVSDYIKTNNYSVDAQRFVDFYESKGWMVGKTKMKSWEAAVRTWQRSNDERRPKSTGSTASQIAL